MLSCKIYNDRLSLIAQKLLLPEIISNKQSAWRDKLELTQNVIPIHAASIEPLIQFLVLTIAPAKIYMIPQGNVAGYQSEETIDLMLIVSGKCGIAFKELEPIINIACSKHNQVSCSLHQEGSVVEWLQKGHIFYSLHCTSVNLVYDDKIMAYPEMSSEDLTRIKHEARKTFNWYFQKAKEFYSCAELLYQKSFSSLVMFMLHQATELTYRSILNSLNGYDRKTHEIRVLKKLTRRCAPGLNTVLSDSEEDKKIIQLLDKAYLEGRYASQYVIEENTLSVVFEKITLLHKTAELIVDQKLSY